ncbi:lactosylceramide 4-alpha-galactosyltransferase-like [Tigriopus californicus]|uniref:lactosylceramide 4-alpha-galactosyltransferase-like n=1 Tax=Tigriopus californicus TaxID=6832 RepID=UPI0027D9F5AA|nr:lactosylceramide 4-alpha-galactosyltransferase-like [Tigriopus californicus]XP_059092021.1 lactosylceramide 4-alpha-galactosyltransferase-like [Tigriopus californicus]XP_059092022.1 lactosylceramide 4-alpha-galactosyltransferase-like [Tigriopus californicus]
MLLHFIFVLIIISFATGFETSNNDPTLLRSSCQLITDISQCPSTRIIDLPDLEGELPLETKVFFIESSGRDHLLHRQACSVESALSVSKTIRSVVTLTARQLNLSHNATCQLYSRFNEPRLIFRRVDRAKIFKNTPIQPVFERGDLDRGPNQIVQNSDALRLLLIRKYGGWYADLDVVFMQDPSSWQNIITGDHHRVVGDGSVIGENLNNAVFHFDKGHPYLELCLEQFAINFDPMVRLSGGPYTMSKALKKICGMEENSIINLNTFTRDRCRGVGVVKQHLLYPLGWFEIDVFTSERKSRSQWAAKYNSSITIHLFNSIAGSDKVVLKPKFYGNDVPAYLYLAERFCPLCYNSVKRF